MSVKDRMEALGRAAADRADTVRIRGAVRA